MSDPMDATSSRPRVSVVIPSYNHARFLPETIASVLNQTLESLELIVIDDGSRDESWAVIQHAAAGDSRIIARRQQNAGAHAAINAGLQIAKGEFLAILNSDDRFHPERLATLTALAEDDGLDFVCTGQILIDDAGTQYGEHPWLEEYERMLESAASNGLWATLLERNFTVSTSNFFIRRSLWQALGPIRPLRYNMDWDYALRAYRHDPRRFAWRHDLPLWDYRLHGRNTILGGLPHSAIEANHLIYRNLQEACGVPARAIAGLRRHHRLIRHQQVTAAADARDQWWEPRLHEAHEGWARTRAESDATHARLGEALTQLAEVRQELAAVYASRSYRWGRRVTAPLRAARSLVDTLRQRQLPASPTPEVDRSGDSAAASAPSPATPQSQHASGVTRQERPPYRVLQLRPAPDDQTLPKVAAHIHIHYPDLLPELLDAAGHIPGEFDLFVTTTQPEATVAAPVLERFPTARVWRTPNQGKDIGPFIDALNRHRLDNYDLVLKLHGKKSRNDAGYLRAIRGLFGKDIADGDDWRRKLIAPIAGDAQRIREIWQAFAEDPALKMVGAARFVCEAPDADPAAYAALCDRLEVVHGIRFFGGTMFWIRGEALTPLLEAGITIDDFSAEKARSVEATLEHAIERVFGALAVKQGGYLGGVEDRPGT